MRNFHQRGVTSVMVLLLMFVALTLMLSLASQSMGTLKRSSNERDSALAFNTAEAALEYQVSLSYAAAKLNLGVFTPVSVNDAVFTDLVTPGGSATASVVPIEDGTKAWITSYGTYKGKTSSSRMLLKTLYMSVWNNAIFSDDGITGDVQAKGSVHILGNDGTTVFGSMDGNSMIGNNYSGMPAAMEGLIPALPLVNGKESLNAVFRVRDGNAYLTGAATIGESTDPDGGTSKGNLDGVYVTDGITGNAGNVYSDNGSPNEYDLPGGSLKFPFIEGPDAEPYVDADSVVWPNHKAFLDARSMTIPEGLIKNKSSFEYGPDEFGNYIKKYKGDSNGPPWFHIEGNIKIDGDFYLDWKEMYYTGFGTIYVSGDMRHDATITPMAGLQYPTDASLGIVVGGNWDGHSGESSGYPGGIAMALYVQGTAFVSKGSNFMGAMVAKQIVVDNSAGVSSMYQVPSLLQNMPPNMPGSNPFIMLTVRSWRARHGP